MVLDCCPEFYVGGKENLLWQPPNDEHQRRCWLAPKADVAAADPVAKKTSKAVPAGLATTLAPAALSSRNVQTSAGRKLSRTYATAHSIAGFRRVPICPLSPKPLPTEILTLDFKYTSNQSEALNETRNPKILGLRERHANVGPKKLQLESETPGSSWNCTLAKPMKTVWRPVGILCNPRCRLSSLQQNGPKDSGDGGKAGPIASRRESLHGVPAHRPTSCGDHQGGPQHSTSSDDAHRPARDLYALHASASSITASVPDVSRDILSRRIPPLRVCEQSHGSSAMRSRASLV